MHKNELNRFTAHADGNGTPVLSGLSDTGYGCGRACGYNNGVATDVGVEWWSGAPLSFHGRGLAGGRGFGDCTGGNRFPLWYPSEQG